tara:strand:- start:946 stop:1422 length:477 start_codon:yes stop_codon:yes gene_type:complete
MARIQTYNLDPTITLEDKVIGSNFIGTVNSVKRFETANYTMGALKDFIGTGTGIVDAVESPANTFTMDLSVATNWKVTTNNAATTLAMTVVNADIGKSGIIVIINHPSGATFTSLPSNMKTPDGAAPAFVTAGNAISILSYFVLEVDKVLVNYVGNFS